MKYILFTNLLFFTFAVTAQQKVVQQKTSQQETGVAAMNVPNLSARYDGGDIILSYNPVLSIRTDSVIINVVRKGIDGEKQIRTNKKIAATSIYKFADTSIRKNPGVYQYLLKATKDNNLLASDDVWAYAYAEDTKPVASKFTVYNIKGTNNNVVKWQLQYAFSLNNLQLKRSRTINGTYETIANLSAKDSLYVDKVQDSNEPFYYRLDMTTHNSQAVYQSISVFVIPQFTIIPNTVTGIVAQQKNNGIVVTWSNSDPIARGYYVKKRVGNAGDFIATSSIILKNKNNNYVWKDTLSALQVKEMYQYVVVAESNSFDQSKNSDTATVSFHSTVKVLSPPNDLRIITANDTTYNLVWAVDSLHIDEAAAYQVYCRPKGAKTFNAIKDGLTTSKINYIEIAKPNDGDTYYVSAVNGDKQSAPSIAYTYTNAFQKDFGPKYLKAAVYDDMLNIKWLKSEVLKFRAYKLYRWDGKAFVLVETISADKDMVATKSYVAGQLNIYKLRTVNLNGVESTGSEVLQVN